MTVTVTGLAERLQQVVPQRNGAPADYAELVKAAVWQLSADAPMQRQTSLAITPGVDTYALPGDFLAVIALSAIYSSNGVIVGDGRLVAVRDGFEERYYIAGTSITFEPTPAYTATRALRYAAAHIPDENGSYQRMSENGVRIALLYAQYLALIEQATAVAGDGWSYKIGDESVDKSRLAASVQAQATAVLAAYQNAVRPLKGYGSQFRHSDTFDGPVEV